MQGYEARANTSSGSASGGSALWDRLDELVDRAPGVPALRAHRLHLAAARLWRSRGLDLPADLRDAERHATVVATAAPALLEQARAAYGGQLMLMKGPEVAACYRYPLDRFFHDLDVLADDAPAAQQALIKAGFLELGDPSAYSTAQHLCPLAWPGIPLVIELHRRPNLPPWLPPVSAGELLELAAPSATGVEGLLAPTPAAHALLLVAHSWTEQPLGRLADLLDLAAVLARGERSAARELARAWEWEGMLAAALEVAGAVLDDTDPSPSLSVWTRHLSSARERTVFENHLARLAAPACALPGRHVPGAVASMISNTVTRREDEPWSDKLCRARLAVVHAFWAKSSHDRTVPPHARGTR